MTLTIFYLLAVPLLVMLAAKRWPVIEKISPMVILYVIGLTVGNVGIVGEGARKPAPTSPTSRCCSPSR